MTTYTVGQRVERYAYRTSASHASTHLITEYGTVTHLTEHPDGTRLAVVWDGCAEPQTYPATEVQPAGASDETEGQSTTTVATLTQGQRVQRVIQHTPLTAGATPYPIIQRGTVTTAQAADGTLLRIDWDAYGEFAEDPEHVSPVDPADIEAEREAHGYAVGDAVERCHFGKVWPGVVLEARTTADTRLRIYWPDKGHDYWHGVTSIYRRGGAAVIAEYARLREGGMPQSLARAATPMPPLTQV